MEQLAFVNFYNLVLTSHIDAILRDDQDNLANAARLWEFVLCVHWDRELQLETKHTLAILANLGHVYHALGCRRKSQSCYRQIEMTVMVAREMREEIFGLDKFFMAVANRILYPPIVAAAA